ncbi:MAG: 3D domain-containing protein [bacterium]|nr:3D domain-containing protein [bacterium]
MVLRSKISKIIYAITMAIVIGVSGMFMIGASNVIIIKDGDKSIHLTSYKSELTDIIKVAGITLEEDDELSVSKEGKYKIINIIRSFPVKISMGNNVATVNLTGGTVADAIQKAGISISNDDLVNYDLDDCVTRDMHIEMTRISYVYDTCVEEIPFENSISYSAKIEKGSSSIITNGIPGEKVVTYCTKLVNGVRQERTVVEETVTKQAVNEKKLVGTGKTPSGKTVATKKAIKTSASVSCISRLVPPSPIALDSNNRPVKYSKVLTGSATAYYNSNNSYCATGVWPTPGYIAVNPKVIPYGTKLYIVSADGRYHYGYAIAADTGGFASGSRTIADLFFDTRSECINFGRRQIEIYILE